ncbi:PKD1L3 [Branchiostoma lanceolatum]|uniref:PKD1L3 protein n=1 Tax=Branchiostoma lanceolatum TaxID=7740 RepID=A0A8J9VHS7_BRALA|nr:PKD1L3 [Branchiostoma lanceolatum]
MLSGEIAAILSVAVVSLPRVESSRCRRDVAAPSCSCRDGVATANGTCSLCSCTGDGHPWGCYEKLCGEYTSLGCWMDDYINGVRTIPQISGALPANPDLLERCCQAAASRGFPVFGVQGSTYCGGSADAQSTYDRYGPSTFCAGGIGGWWSNDVYQITGAVVQCETLHATGCSLTSATDEPPGDVTQPCNVTVDIHEGIRSVDNPLRVHQCGNISLLPLVSIRCNHTYNVSVRWTVRGNDTVTLAFKEAFHEFLPKGYADKLKLDLPAKTLPAGLLLAQVTVTIEVPEIGHTSIGVAQTWLEVLPFPIVAQVFGSSTRTLPLWHFWIRASLAHDPDCQIPSDKLSYAWSCEAVSYPNPPVTSGDLSACEALLGDLQAGSDPDGGSLHFDLLTKPVPQNSIVKVSLVISAEGHQPGHTYINIHTIDVPGYGEYRIICSANCNPGDLLAHEMFHLTMPASVDTSGPYTWTLEEAPADFPGLDWTNDILVLDSSNLKVRPNVFTVPGNYTIRATTYIDPAFPRIAEYRFLVIRNPVPRRLLQDSSAEIPPDVCSVIPAQGVSLVDKFCIVCEEFYDELGPLRMDIRYKIEAQNVELSAVKFPGEGPATPVDIVVNAYSGWVFYTPMLDIAPGNIIIELVASSADGRSTTVIMDPILITAPNKPQLIALADAMSDSQVEPFYSLLALGSSAEAFMSSVTVAAVAASLANRGEDITEVTDIVAENMANVELQDYDGIIGLATTILLVTAFPEYVSGAVHVFKASEMKAMAEQEGGVGFSDMLEANKEATTKTFQALDVLDDIYLLNIMPAYYDDDLFADIYTSKIHVRIEREDPADPSERLYTVAGVSDSFVRVPSISALVGDDCPGGETVGVQIFHVHARNNMSSMSFSLDFNSTLFPHDVTLWLRKHEPPTPDNYTWTTTLPVPDDELISVPWVNGTSLSSSAYHWLLREDEIAITDEDVDDKTDYFIGVRFGSESDRASGETVNFTLYAFETSCVYFEENGTHLWQSDGCRVGLMSNITHIHCQCDHLTKFAGFVAPNPLNIQEALSANILENPAGLILVLTVFASYLMGIVWARKADRKDIAKAGVGLLPGHKLNPRKECQYVITVYTGFRGNAGTTAEVTLVLYGSQYESPPFTLRDDNRCLYEQGSVDSFLLSTEEPLGVLTHMRVWHNNAGFSPSWYLSQIVVVNRGTNAPDFFLCNRWFAVDEDDGKIERAIPTSVEEDMTRFRNLFLAKSSRDMNDGHLWYSVKGRPARSPFTRVQRLSCCLTLLYSTMITNIMFFGRGDDFDPPEPLRIAGVKINPPISLPQLMIGIQSALIILPVNLLIVFLFRNSGTPVPKKGSGKKSNSEPGRRVVEVSHRRPKKEQAFNSDNPDVPSVWHPVVGVHKLRVLQASLDDDVEERSKMRDVDKDNAGLEQKWSLPWWGALVGWLLVWSASFVAAFFTVLYTLSFGRAKAEAWVFTFVTSFVSDLFLVQPVKLVLVAVLFALFTKKPVEDDDPPPKPTGDDEEYIIYNKGDSPTWRKLGTSATSWTRYFTTNRAADYATNSKFPAEERSTSPPDESVLAEARAKSAEKRKRRAAVLEVIVFGLFVTVIMLTAYQERSPLAFYMTQNVKGQIVEGDFSGIKDIESFWSWVEHDLIPTTRSAEWYNGQATTADTVLQDMLTHPLDAVQLRQVRLKQGMDSSKRDRQQYRYGNMYADITDTNQYCFPYFGLHGTYHTGGYLAPLGKTRASGLRSATFLQQRRWLDERTRAVFVELILYNPHANLFSSMTLVVEFTNLGAAYKGAEVVTLRLIQHDAILLLVLRAVLAVFILFFAIKEVKRLLSRPMEYLTDFWSWMELLVIIVGVATLGVYFNAQAIIDEAAEQRTSSSAIFSLYKSAVSWFQVYTYLLALLICCGTLKFIRLLRFNSHVHALTMTVRKSSRPILQFTFMAGIVLMAFTQMGNFLFGTKLQDYKNIPTSLQSLCTMMLGSFDFDALVDGHWVLGPLMFFSYQVMMQFILLSMFMAILMDVYAEESQDPNTDSDLRMVGFIRETTSEAVGKANRTLSNVGKRNSKKTDQTGTPDLDNRRKFSKVLEELADSEVDKV